MTQVIVSPSEMRSFSKELTELAAQIMARDRQLDAELKQLGTTWADEKYRKFSRAHVAMSQQLREFQRLSQQFASFLGEKARAGDRYLGR